MKFAIGITLYNPEMDNIDYILQIKDKVEITYVFDNSCSNETCKELMHVENVIYSSNGANDGLSKAFNWFLKSAYEDKVDFLLLLDQDSMFSWEAFEHLKNNIEKLSSSEQAETAMFACKTITCKKDGDAERKGIHCVDKVISSGCFLNIDLLYKNNLFYDEDLFIDHVDFEFCERVRRAGFKILVDDTYKLKQQLGYEHKGVICHSPVRHYYMTRDMGYINEKNHARIRAEYLTFRYFIRELCIALKEDDSLTKLTFVLKGYLDYKRNIKGVYSR